MGIYGTIETNNHINIIMEYLEGESLLSWLKKQPNRRGNEFDVKKIILQIIKALEYCHSKEIAHRDIKLENILIDEKLNAKLIDFGFSTYIPNN